MWNYIDYDELINICETAKQSLGMEDEGLNSPQSCGRKRRKLKWKSKLCYTTGKEMMQKKKHSISLLKCVVTNKRQKSAFLKVHDVCLLRVKTIKLLFWYHKNV